MTLDMTPNLIAGAAVALGGACLGFKQMLSAPDRPNYPTTGPWARFIMFWLSAFLIARGLEIVTLSMRPDAVAMTWTAVAVSLLVSAYFGNQLYAHLTQRTSARTQKLIQRIHTMARCAPSDGLVKARTSAAKGVPIPAASVATEALVALSLKGVRVAAPNEGPEAFTGPWQ